MTYENKVAFMSPHVLSQILSRNEMRLRELCEFPMSSTRLHECLTSLTKASRAWYLEVAAAVIGELLLRICDEDPSLPVYMNRQRNKVWHITLT